MTALLSYCSAENMVEITQLINDGYHLIIHTSCVTYPTLLICGAVIITAPSFFVLTTLSAEKHGA